MLAITHGNLYFKWPKIVFSYCQTHYFIYHELYSILGVAKLYNLISLLVAAGSGVVIYGILCYILGIEEVKEIIGRLKVRLS